MKMRMKAMESRLKVMLKEEAMQPEPAPHLPLKFSSHGDKSAMHMREMNWKVQLYMHTSNAHH